jgi:2-polyprenyl-3-methyl-5-hydroxy-6-metoxy-1,4-benzoquinol methylase
MMHVGYTNEFCPVCKSREHAHFHTVRGHDVVRCRDCRFLFTRVVPSDNELHEHYRQKYCNTAGEFRPRTTYHRRLKYQALRYAMRWWCRDVPQIKLLEIGCHQGDLLAAVRNDRKFNAHGIDLAQRPLDYARSQGLSVELTDLESRRFDDNSFDMIVALHVLEHVQNPERLVGEIRRILKPGGKFFAVMPCSGHIKARLAGVNWHYLTPPQHLWYFTPHTLAMFVERMGLSTLFSSNLYHRAHVRILAQKPKPYVDLQYATWMGTNSNLGLRAA